jgi:hypothetical protein
MPKVNKSRKKWNTEVKTKTNSLNPIKTWLEEISKTKTDWGTQKSAHQALRFLELAQYEMWNMQWWDNAQQVKFHTGAEKETVV